MIHEFDTDLKFGNKWEAQMQRQFTKLVAPTITRIFYKTNPEIQKSGIDMIAEYKPISFDVKVRRTYYPDDLLIETVSIIEQNKPGWLYYSKSDAILYLWLNKPNTRIQDGYIIYLDDFKKWFVLNADKFKTKIARSYKQISGMVWSTENKVVPVSMIPVHMITRFNKSMLNIDEQVLLEKWI